MSLLGTILAWRGILLLACNGKLLESCLKRNRQQTALIPRGNEEEVILWGPCRHFTSKGSIFNICSVLFPLKTWRHFPLWRNVQIQHFFFLINNSRPFHFFLPTWVQNMSVWVSLIALILFERKSTLKKKTTHTFLPLVFCSLLSMGAFPLLWYKPLFSKESNHVRNSTSNTYSPK